MYALDLLMQFGEKFNWTSHQNNESVLLQQSNHEEKILDRLDPISEIGEIRFSGFS
jgi:hypothetical protein